MGFAALDMPRALRPGAARRDHQFGKGMGKSPHIKKLRRKSIHLAIPPQTCEVAVFVSRIGNSHIIKHLDVKEAEDSLLPDRLCAAGLDVSKDADRIESAIGVATFATPSRFFEKKYHRDNFLGSSRSRLALDSPLGYPLE